MSTEIDDLKEWIAKLEKDGMVWHGENIQRMAVLEERWTQRVEADKILAEKVDSILRILTQVDGVVTLLKVLAWIVGIGGGAALIGGFFKSGGH